MLKVSDKHVIGEYELDKYTFEIRLVKVTEQEGSSSSAIKMEVKIIQIKS